MTYPRIATLKTAESFQDELARQGVALPFDAVVESGPSSPLASSITRSAGSIGNRFCILPMEGWDGTADGRPSELTRRRWRNFGLSGAKLIWGGEAVAVRQDGRANPHQLLINEQTLPDLRSLREDLVRTHEERFGRTDDLLVGLQLTHSGRFSRPHSRTLEPRTVYHHPLLTQKFSLQNTATLLTDDDIIELIGDFVQGARLAREAGFSFIDIKHCHGYLGHEFLSAIDRPGRFGGSFENRTRFLREIVAGIRQHVPGLEIGVRVSVYDFVPFQAGDQGIGIPMASTENYRYAFGGDGTGRGIDLAEPLQLMALLKELGIELVCTTAGSPYYNPHLMRPATFPPSDGYLPPESPLVGVARQIDAAARIKALHPELILVGSGYSYLQEWLPNVGQAVIRNGMADFIGLGRMVLSYPDLPADIIDGKSLKRKQICRTFSDCTTAPRNGLVSGCYPLDSFYKDRPEREQLALVKQNLPGR